MSLDTLPTPNPVTLGRVGTPPLLLSRVMLGDKPLLLPPARTLLGPPPPPPPLAPKDLADDALGPEEAPFPPDPVVCHSSSTGDDLSPAATAALYSPLSQGVSSRAGGAEAVVVGAATVVEGVAVVELVLRPLASNHSSGAGIEQASQSSLAFFMVHTEQVHSSSRGTAEGVGALAEVVKVLWREALVSCSPTPANTPDKPCPDTFGDPAD